MQLHCNKVLGQEVVFKYSHVGLIQLSVTHENVEHAYGHQSSLFIKLQRRGEAVAWDPMTVQRLTVAAPL